MTHERTTWRRWLSRRPKALKPKAVKRFYRPIVEALEDRAMPALAGSLDSLFGVGGAALAQFGTSGAQAYGIYRDTLTNTGAYAAGVVNNGTTDQIALVRINPDGSRDFGFGNQGLVITPLLNGSQGDRAEDIIGGISPTDGKFKIIVVGETWNGANYDITAVRYNADGSLDATFGTAGKVTINLPANLNDQAFRVLFDNATGKTLLAGSTNTGNQNDFVLIRLNENGSLDNSFGAGGMVVNAFGSSDSATGLAIDGSGRIVVGGTTQSSTTGRDFFVARFDSTGKLDASFGAGGFTRIDIAGSSDDVASSLRIDSIGNIVIAGTVRTATEDFAIVRLTSTGALDSSFSGGKVVFSLPSTPNQNDRLNDIAIDGSDRIVAVGTTQGISPGGPVSTVVARFTSVGTLDASFGTGGFTQTLLSGGRSDQTDDAEAVAFDASGNILVAGHTYYQTSDVMDVVRYLGSSSASASALAAATHSYTVPAGQPFEVAVSGQVGLLAGATLNNNTPISTALFGGGPAQGTVVVNADGSFVYTPSATASGADSFQYLLVDQLGGKSAPATVTLTIQSAGNLAPVLTGTVPLPGLLEDDVSNPGLSVGLLTQSPYYSDANSADGRGVAITYVDTTNGLWQYRLTGATTWIDFPTIDPTVPEALLLFDTSSIRFVPNANYNGTATFKYLGWDRTNGFSDGLLTEFGGTGGSNSYSDLAGAALGTIAITAVNDPPSFVGGSSLEALEDAPPQTIYGWATSITPGPPDEAGQTITFTVTNDNNALFAVQPAVAADGTLTYTLAPDANGIANVVVVAVDNGGTLNGGFNTSETAGFTISVSAVNDPPKFTLAGDQTIPEDANLQTIANFATGISPGPPDEVASGQAVSFTVSSDNTGLFATPPTIDASGTLSYAAFADANGTATITVIAFDGAGGVSAPQTFTITVTPVNDPPSFAKGADQAILEDAPPQSIAGWATSISPGPADEAGQTVSFVVANDNPGLFAVGPAVAVDGTLTYTLAANANGLANVTVYALDSGGTSGGGINMSNGQTFTISVAAVNDSPSFVKGPDQTVLENAPPQSIAGWATNIVAGPPDESAQKLTFSVSYTNDSLFLVGPSIASDGTLAYTLRPSANGVALVTVTLRDDGGVLNNGNDTSPSQTFVITVVPVADFLPADNDVLPAIAEDSGSFTTPFSTLLVNDLADPFFGSSPNLSIVGVSDAVGGTVAFTRTGIAFTPTADYNGAAGFFYTLHDNNAPLGQTDEYLVQVTFTITEVNDPPILQNQTLTAYDPSLGSRFISWSQLLQNARAGPANEASQQVIGVSAFNAVGGTVVAVVGGVVFTPQVGFNGVASFTFFAVDNGTTNGAADPQSATATASFVVGPQLPPAATSPGSTGTTPAATTLEALATSSAATPTTYPLYSQTNNELNEFSRSIRAVLAGTPPTTSGVRSWGEVDPRIAVVAQILQSNPEARLATPTLGLTGAISGNVENATRGRLLQIVTSQFDGEDNVWIIEGLLRNQPAAPATVRPATLPSAPLLAPATPEPPAPTPEQSSWLAPAGRMGVGLAAFMGLIANVALTPFVDKQVFSNPPRRQRKTGGHS